MTERITIEAGKHSGQSSTTDALNELFAEIQKDQARKKAQAEKGIDSLTFFVLNWLQE